MIGRIGQSHDQDLGQAESCQGVGQESWGSFHQENPISTST